MQLNDRMQRRNIISLSASITFFFLVDCSFDLGTCSWKNIGGDQFDWTRRSYSTPSRGTGPLSDRGGKGTYITQLFVSELTYLDVLYSWRIMYWPNKLKIIF